MAKGSSGAPLRKITLMLLAANFLFGLGVLAILPPFEGMDETAHFSRLQAQAFAGEADAKTLEHISTFVFDYYRRGPMPYGWIDNDQLHRSDPARGYMTYREFFAQPAHVKNFEESYRRTVVPTGFRPSAERNWQYQHPAFFYIVTAPDLKMLAGHASLVSTMLVLRLFCYAMAMAGFFIGVFATWKYLDLSKFPGAGAVVALGLLYPFLMPEFFWEFARIGNDSLCLFLFGLIWAALLWHLRDPDSGAWYVLGICIAVSWLAKAFMIPITLGIVVFLALYHASALRNKAGRWWVPVAKLVVLLAVAGALIYFIGTGSTGSEEFRQAANFGGLGDFFAHRFSVEHFLNDFFQIFFWAEWWFGSWSQLIIDVPLSAYALLCMSFAAIMFIYFLACGRQSQPLLWLPPWVIGPLLLGLTAHLIAVQFIAHGKDSVGSTPGYYLHILAPCFALIYGVSLKFMSERKLLKMTAIYFGIPVILFNFFIAWSHMAAFSGCAAPVVRDKSFWLPPSAVFHCAGHIFTVSDRLAVLAWPKTAMICFALSLLLLVKCGLMAKRGIPTVTRKLAPKNDRGA